MNLMNPKDLLTLTQWAQIIYVIFTFAGVIAVLWQIRSAKNLQNKAAARQLYAEFLVFAANKHEALQGTKDDLKWGTQYEWAVYLWLTALESGWLAFGRDLEWKRRIASFARQNRPYLESNLWNSLASTRSENVKLDFDRRFVDEVDRAFKVERDLAEARKNSDAIA